MGAKGWSQGTLLSSNISRLGLFSLRLTRWLWESNVVGNLAQVKILVDQMGVVIMHSLDEPLEWDRREEEWLILIKKLIDVYSVRVLQVAFDDNLFMTNCDHTVSKQYS